jgi:hypothetical protein
MAFVLDNLQNFLEQVQTAFPDLALGGHEMCCQLGVAGNG